MCDLFGINCNAKDRATRSLPAFSEEFSAVDPHGWGIAYYDEHIARVVKVPGRADQNGDFPKVVEEARSNIILAHLRFKTTGEQCTINCHPFHDTAFGKDWVFAHNGSVQYYESGRHKHPRSEGTTDSESVFHNLLDWMQEYIAGRPIGGIYPALKFALQQLFKQTGGNLTMNFLLSDGTVLYAFNHYPGKPMYYLTRVKAYGGALLVSTQRLLDDPAWKAIPADRLFVACGGSVLLLSSLLEI